MAKIMSAWMAGSVRGCFFTFRMKFLTWKHATGGKEGAMRLLSRMMVAWLAGSIRGYLFNWRQRYLESLNTMTDVERLSTEIKRLKKELDRLRPMEERLVANEEDLQTARDRIITLEELLANLEDEFEDAKLELEGSQADKGSEEAMRKALELKHLKELEQAEQDGKDREYNLNKEIDDLKIKLKHKEAEMEELQDFYEEEGNGGEDLTVKRTYADDMLIALKQTIPRCFSFQPKKEPPQNLKSNLHDISEDLTKYLKGEGTTALNGLQVECDRVQKEIENITSLFKNMKREYMAKPAMVWEYEYPSLSGIYHRIAKANNEIVENGLYKEDEMVSVDFRPTYNERQTKLFCIYPLARKMVEVDSGMPFNVRRRQPVTQYLTLGIGVLFNVDPDTNEIVGQPEPGSAPGSPKSPTTRVDQATLDYGLIDPDRFKASEISDTGK